MPRLYTSQEVAFKTGIPETLLRKMRSETYKTGQQVGPIFCKIRGRVFYRLDDVRRWIEWVEVVSSRGGVA